MRPHCSLTPDGAWAWWLRRTRALPGEMLPFKKGAFHMAVQAGVPIVPIALKNSDALMGRGTGEAWPGTIEMVMFPPVGTLWVSSDDDLGKLVQRVQEIIMKELGVKKLSKRGNALPT